MSAPSIPVEPALDSGFGAKTTMSTRCTCSALPRRGSRIDYASADLGCSWSAGTTRAVAISPRKRLTSMELRSCNIEVSRPPSARLMRGVAVGGCLANPERRIPQHPECSMEPRDVTYSHVVTIT